MLLGGVEGGEEYDQNGIFTKYFKKNFKGHLSKYKRTLIPLPV